jgi:hypothetical protein
MKRVSALAAAFILVLTPSLARAQSGYAAQEINRIQTMNDSSQFSSSWIRDSAYRNAMPRMGLSATVSRNLFGNALNRPNKPFSSVSKGPSVTPYLALDQPFTNSATQYYTQIRPRQEQQRLNQQMERQTQLMQRQLSEVTARPPYDPRGSESMAPTGHTAVFMTNTNFMNYGGYYQQPRPQRR